MSERTEVLVGQVWRHPLDGTLWEVRTTDPSVTRLERIDLPSLMWVSTPALGSSWRLPPAPGRATS